MKREKSLVDDITLKNEKKAGYRGRNELIFKMAGSSGLRRNN